MRRHPNNTGQYGQFVESGETGYISVATTYDPLPGKARFATRATADEWAAGDTLYVRAEASFNNYFLAKVSWDPDNFRLNILGIEETFGSVDNGASVSVRAVLTEQMLIESLTNLQVYSGTTVTAQNFVPQNGAFVEVTEDIVFIDSNSLNGVTLCLTSPTSISIYLDPLPEGFHIALEKESDADVTFYVSGTGTINGGSTLEWSGQWVGAYLYQRTAGVWVANL